MDGPSETAVLSLEADINPFGDANPRWLTVIGSALYFIADDGVGGPELWRYINADNIVQVRVFGNSPDDELFGIKAVDGAAYFFFYNSADATVELWTSRGSGSDTVQIANLGPLADLALDIEVSPDTPLDAIFRAIARRYSPVFIPNWVYLPGLDEDGDFEILRTKGTAQSTEQTFNVNSNGSAFPALFNVISTDVVMSATTFGQGEELMLFNPGGDSARRLSDVRRPGDASPSLLMDVDGVLHFAAKDGIRGIELWRVDEEAGTVSAVADLSPNDLDDGKPVALAELDGVFVFVTQDGDYHYELWAAGPDLIKLADVSQLGVPITVQFAKVENQIFFTAEDGENGFELWRTNGTLSGTRLVKDIHLSGDANPQHFANLDGMLFFSADDGEHGIELWRSDGTSAGTVMVEDINVGGSSRPEYLTVMDGNVYFSANDGVDGVEIWRTGPNEEDVPAMVRNINPSGDANPRLFTVVDDVLYFVANDGTNGLELWRSHGSEAGTVLVKDINTGGGGAIVTEMAAMGDGLYFVADDGGGEALWTSDGSGAGTVQVADIRDDGNAMLRQLTAFDGNVYFSANDGVHGHELWRSDGTAQGTELVMDINAEASANPMHLKAVGGKLYFAADDGDIGVELWVVDPDGDQPDPGGGGSGGTPLTRSSDNGGAGAINPLLVLLAAMAITATGRAKRRGR